DSPPSTFEIWRYDFATATAGPVLTRHDDGMTVEQPRISPDGDQVVYMRVRFRDDRLAHSAIFVADLTGGPERRLTPWDLYATHPDWSIDGRIVFNTFDIRLYSQDAFPGARDLYVTDAAGTTIRPITRNGSEGPIEGQPHWTPDGRSITYT